MKFNNDLDLIGNRIFGNSGYVEDVSGTTYTVLLVDNGKVKRFTNSSNVVITLPQGLPIGVGLDLISWGAGGITIQGDGTSVVPVVGSVAQYQAITAIVVATNTWATFGLIT